MRIPSRLAALLYVAFVLGVAIFAGSAFAGNGNGNGGNSGSAPGQVKKEEAPPAATPVPVATPAAAPAAKHQPKAVEHAQAKAHAAKSSHVAPDTSKQYGNGKSALQIAHEQAPKKSISASDLSGPGNSGPHKVTICHNGHLITVDVHALKAHSSHLDGSDVIPATSASQCAAHAAAAAAQTALAPALQTQQPCTGTTTETVTTPGYVLHHTGSKTNPWVKLKYNAHSAHVTGKHPDDVVVAPQTVTRTVAVPAGCASTSTSVATSAPVAAQSTEASSSAGVVSATQALTGAAAPAATSAGGVLGATATLTPAKAAAKPAARRAGGVLGATTRIGSAVASSNLPFTGLPLWIFVAVAAMLVVAGVAVRRSAGARD